MATETKTQTNNLYENMMFLQEMINRAVADVVEKKGVPAGLDYALELNNMVRVIFAEGFEKLGKKKDA